MSSRSDNYQMVLTLQNHPLASVTEIGELLDISWPTAKKRYRDAIDTGLIHGVIANVKYKNLGLRRHIVIAQIDDYVTLKYVEDICDLHPYTIYRSRIVGSQGLSLFMIFHVPDTSNGDNNIKDLFLILSRSKFVNDYVFYTCFGPSTISDHKIEYFDPDTNSWKFDPEKWLANLVEESPEIAYEEITPVDLSNYSVEYFYLLRLMNMNVLEGQQAIRTKYEEKFGEISKSEFHRRYSKLVRELVDSYELHFDYSKFDISEHFLYNIPNMTQKEVQRLFHLMRTNPPPFRFTMEVVGQNNVILYGNIPSMLARKISYQIWKMFPQTEFYQFSSERGWSARYYFYHENFDDENKNWKDSFEYIIREPLKPYKEFQKYF